jgi:hypothetical protein
VTRDIKKRQGNTGSDKLNSLSNLVNAYNRLLERSDDNKEQDSEPSGAGYYETMEKDAYGEIVAK